MANTSTGAPEQICNHFLGAKKTREEKPTTAGITQLTSDRTMERSSIRRSIHIRTQDLKYRIRYLVTAARCHHYSDNHNPRILQTRRPNAPFITLRLVPNDQYLLRKGEYLTLEALEMRCHSQSQDVVDLSIIAGKATQPKQSDENLIDLDSEIPYPLISFESMSIEPDSYEPIAGTPYFYGALSNNANPPPTSRDQSSFCPLSDEIILAMLHPMGSAIGTSCCPYPPQLSLSYSDYYPSVVSRQSLESAANIMERPAHSQ